MPNVVDLYAVSMAGIFAVFLVLCTSRWVTPYHPHIRFWTLSRIVYPLRRQAWTSVVIDFALLGVYIIVNGVCLGVGIDHMHLTSDLMRRSSQLSSVNTVLLFLGSNVLVDAFGIPLHTYYLAHYWIGGMAVTQALLHTGLAISSQEWALDSRTISGLVVASALTFILLTSLCLIRGIVFLLYSITHMLLALTVIGGTIWHILPSEFITLFFPIFSISVWSITTLYRLVRICNRRGYIASYNSFSQPALADPRFCATKFTVRVRQHLDACPGQYVYFYFSGLRWRYRSQAHPFMIAWREYGVEDTDGSKIDITNLTFLVQPRRGLTARLASELRLSELSFSRPSFQNPVLFDGPFGRDLHLERYETVLLVAEGIGIAGVLPYAQQLAQRSHHDGEIKKSLKLASTQNKDELRKALYRDATRKVDLFWTLELNRQEEWVSEHLRTLQDLDPGRRRNLIYCYYPEKKTSEPLIKLDEGWRCFYPGDPQPILDAVIKEEARKSRRNIVVACGNTTFTQSIQKNLLEIMTKDNIVEFAEVECRPRGFRNQDDAKIEATRLLWKRQHTRATNLPGASEEVELAPLPTREARNVLSKAPGMQVMGRVHESGLAENSARVRATAFV